MTEIELLVLRVLLGVTFIFAGYFIYKDPAGWLNLMLPWTKRFLPKNTNRMMLGVALFDVLLGIWLLTPLLTWLAALFAVLHLLQVFLIVGVSKVTYRNIGLLGAGIFLFLYYAPFL